MLGGTYSPAEIRFATRRLVEKSGGTFRLGEVVTIDAEARLVHLDAGDPVPYDVLSCNLGSHVDRDIMDGNPVDIFPVKPIDGLMAARERILSIGSRKSITIGVVGGGPSSVEIAGNLHRLTRTPGMRPAAIKILTQGGLMPRHPGKVRKRAAESLRRRGIEVLENHRILRIQTGCVVEEDGNSREFDILFLATGVKPNPVFSRSGLRTGPSGGLWVNRYLQHPRHPEIFGGGDCIHFAERPLDKVGVYAVRQNPILLHNLWAALEGTALRPFEPQADYLLIFNLGDGTGIFHRRPIHFGGRLAFKIKDYIDRNFMRRFQRYEVD
jgi:NADH dehydrogenase FAD-containing subunit